MKSSTYVIYNLKYVTEHMLNIFEWGKNSCQVVLEGTSFYFIHKLPIAFRMFNTKKIYTIKKQQAEQPMDFLNALAITGKLFYLVPEEFNKQIKKAYMNALFTGVKRITKERFNLEPEGDEDVTDE